MNLVDNIRALVEYIAGEIKVLKAQKPEIPSVEIGSVLTGEVASVTNSGTDTAVILDFVLPRPSSIEYVQGNSVSSLFSPVYFASKARGAYLSLIHSSHAGMSTDVANEFLIVTTFNTYSQANRVCQQAMGISSAKLYTRGTTAGGVWGGWNSY